MQKIPIPTTSSPLKAGIRTTELYLTLGIGALISVFSGIDPHVLPPRIAGWMVTALGVLYTLQRGLLKVVALQRGLGIDPPITDPKLQQTITSIVDQAVAVEQLIAQYAGLLGQPRSTVGPVVTGETAYKQFFGETTTAGVASGSGSVDPVATAAASLTSSAEAGVQPPEDVTAHPIPPEIADGSAARPDGPPVPSQ